MIAFKTAYDKLTRKQRRAARPVTYFHVSNLILHTREDGTYVYDFRKGHGITYKHRLSSNSVGAAL